MERSGNPKSVNAGKLVETLVSRFETWIYFAIKKEERKKEEEEEEEEEDELPSDARGVLVRETWLRRKKVPPPYSQMLISPF